MYKEIKIGKVTVPLLANGATPYRYNMVFKKDVITEFQAAEGDVSKVVTSIPELAFIMNKAAEAQKGEIDMNLLNKEMYYEWLEQFEAMDLPMATEDIVDVYMANNKISSEPKKKG